MSAVPEMTALHGESARATGAVYLCLLLGRILFSFGATTQRIHDSIVCLARYLQCDVEMLVSYDALLLTVSTGGGTFRTRIDSSRGVAGLNLLGLTRVSEVLRGIPNSKPTPEDLERTLCTLRDTPSVHGLLSRVFAAGCAGAGFCIANGGDPLSWVCSFLVAGFIFAIRQPLAGRNFNVHLTLFAVALLGSLLACLLAQVTQTVTPAIALIAPVLFLVPGVPMINGGIDIVRNHVTIGIARVGYTLAVLVALCLGVGLSVLLLPSPTTPQFALPEAWEIVLVSIAGALAAGALACLNNGSFPQMGLCALGGLAGRLVRALMTLSGLDVITASLIAVLCSTLFVGSLAERLRWPAVVLSVMAALPMVPGYFAIGGLHSLLAFAAAKTPDPAQLAAAIQALTRALFISVALVVGVIGPVVLLQRERQRV